MPVNRALHLGEIVATTAWNRSRRKFIRTKFKPLWARRFALVGERTDTSEFIHALKMEQDHAYYAEYFVQRKRPYKYSLRGLKPLARETIS